MDQEEGAFDAQFIHGADIGEDERGGRIARRLDPKDRRILIGWLKPTDSRC